MNCLRIVSSLLAIVFITSSSLRVTAASTNTSTTTTTFTTTKGPSSTITLTPTSTLGWYGNATTSNATSSSVYSNYTTTITTTVDSSSSITPTPTSSIGWYGNATTGNATSSSVYSNHTTTITTTVNSSSSITPTPTSTLGWYGNATTGNATSSSVYSNHTTTITTTVDSSSSITPTPTSTLGWYGNATASNATSSSVYSNHTTTITTTVDSSSSITPTPTSTVQQQEQSSSIVPTTDSGPSTLPPTAQPANFTTGAPTTSYGNVTTGALTPDWNTTTPATAQPPTSSYGNATTGALTPDLNITTPATAQPPTSSYGNATTGDLTPDWNITTPATAQPPTSSYGNATTGALTPDWNITTSAPTTTPLGPDPIMYPYGTEANDTMDTGYYYWRCPEVQLDMRGMVFYGRRHYKLYVCRNGVISFNSPWYRWWPKNFARRYWFDENAILAPYWALIDRRYAFSRGVSKVFYHLYKDGDKDPATKDILRRAVEDVNRHTKDNMLPKEFTKATLVLVVTWVKIKHWYSRWNSKLQDKYNTFQAVLITDNQYSFVMYNYPRNGIQWSVPADRKDYDRYRNFRGLPVVGFNAGNGKDIYYDHPRSGRVMVVDIDQIDGLNVFKSPDSQTIQTTGNGMRGRVFIRLEDSRGETDHRLKCVNWYYQQRDPRTFTQSLEPCPCSWWQAWRDRRFIFRMWAWPRYCFYSRFPSSEGWGQECCYKFERTRSWWWWWSWISFLATGFPDGGNAHRFHKYRYPNEYKYDDKQAYENCCEKSNMCWMYQEARPSDTCSRYIPPRWSWFWGDPHFVTLDGKNYTFNGLGEYVMLDAKEGFFQLQARTRLAKGDGTATVFSGAVAKEGNSVPVQVTLPYNNGTIEVLVNGKPAVDFKILTNESVDLDNGSVSISKPEKQCLEMSFPSGMSVTICEKQNILSIVTAAPESFKNKTKGLLGTWNGDPDDDFTLPNGTVLPHDMSGRDIHYKFGMAWQVTNETSLFTYDKGESLNTFLNTSFVPMFLDQLKFDNDSLREEAETKCQGDVSCLFDAASTKDVEIGLSTKQLGSQLVNDSKKMSNDPPKISNSSSVIELRVNTTANVIVEVTDADEDSITLNVTGLPADGRVISSNSSVWTITWRVTTQKLDLQFIASDGESVSALKPKIYLCACHHGGKCEKPSKITGADSGEEKFIEMACNCVDGYTGKYCETDIDACEANLNPCYPGVDCIDLPPPANMTDGYKCGPCPAGYSGKGASCKDIDECGLINGGCEHNCLNKPGSYECSCRSGYQLKADKKTCEDINECNLGRDDCMHTCTNTPGSYKCFCNDNFKVKPGKPNLCVPKNPCTEGEHGCNQVCYKVGNDHKCSCHKGYELKDDEKTCQDVDECATNKNRCNQKCHNTKGSYTCSCLMGFSLSSDNKTCVDINECMEWTFNCTDPSLLCVNTDGSYKCECEEGLYWNATLKKCVGLKKGQKPPPPPPAPKPKEPNQNETMNAVNITMKNFNVSKWNKPKEKKFKKAIADATTTYCRGEKNKCSSAVRRTRRSTGFIEWTQDDIHLMPGFPIQIISKKYPVSSLFARLAFYVNFPRSVMLQTGSTVNSDFVLKILNTSRDDIEKALNSSIIEFSVHKEKPREEEKTKEKKDMLPIIIGATVGGTVLIVMITVVAVICYKRSKTKVSPEHIQMKEASSGGASNNEA